MWIDYHETSHKFAYGPDVLTSSYVIAPYSANLVDFKRVNTIDAIFLDKSYSKFAVA